MSPHAKGNRTAACSLDLEPPFHKIPKASSSTKLLTKIKIKEWGSNISLVWSFPYCLFGTRHMLLSTFHQMLDNMRCCFELNLTCVPTPQSDVPTHPPIPSPAKPRNLPILWGTVSNL